MEIKKILSQHRRDFTAIYKCEHCENETESSGYDDSYFHQEVIPNMECSKCKKKSSEKYKPRATKYKDSQVV
jgi:DNA replicative helicase MCM subunit Mcm2 (Cdc46/Mcm family)